MKRDLTQVDLKLVMTYHPAEGLFTKEGFQAPAGVISRGYVHIAINGNRYFAHQLAHLYMTGSWPDNEIDHINGDGCDNRWVNLRDVTHFENMQNVHLPNGNNKSGVRGVSWNRQNKGWMAQITANGKTYTLGFFKSVPEGETAYKAAKAKLHSATGGAA